MNRVYQLHDECQGDTRKTVEKEYLQWPQVIRSLFDRAKKENGWDDITAYYMLLSRQIWLPTGIAIKQSDLSKAVAKLPARYRVSYDTEVEANVFQQISNNTRLEPTSKLDRCFGVHADPSRIANSDNGIAIKRNNSCQLEFDFEEEIKK